MKVSIIGAGNVGTTCAAEIAEREIVEEVILLDIHEGIPEGKALDICEASPIQNFETRIEGVSNDYSATANSNIIVIAAGLPRKPGMSRDDLTKMNALIVRDVTRLAIAHSPGAIIIVVSNPLDIMTYVAYRTSGLSANRVFGMAGILDTARYKSFIARELNISPKSIHAVLLGGHAETMVPLVRYTSVAGIPVTELLSKDRLEKIIERTRQGGTELVNLMGTSAWYAPASATAQMVEAVVKNSRRVFPVSALLNGEYKLTGIFMGVPIVLGRNGVEKIINLQLTEEELKLVHHSAEHIRQQIMAVNSMNIF
ncbi:MAG: malate dehydrogenase [Ignavibacteria bacterium]